MCKAEELGRSTKAHTRNLVSLGARGRRDSKLTAKEMDFMTEIPETFGSEIKVPLGSSSEGKLFIGQADFHRLFSFLP